MHFAHITNGVVDSVIVIEQDILDANNGWYCPACGEHKPKEEWVETSYNTHAGEHKQGGEPLRKNFAGRGYFYDKESDSFVPPKPHESFVLDKEKCIWIDVQDIDKKPNHG